MKKVNFLFATILVALLFCYSSCSDKDESTEKTPILNSSEQELKIESLFSLVDEKIKTKSTRLNSIDGVKKDDTPISTAITFLVIRDNLTGNITLSNFKSEEYFVLPDEMFSEETNTPESRISKTEFTTSSPESVLENKKGYRINCKGGSAGNWSKKCSGKFSCGKEVVKCLDQGGCAEVCEVPVEFIEFNAEEFVDIELNQINLEDVSAVEIAFIE